MLASTLLPLFALLPSLSLAFSDKSSHELSRSRARAHYAKMARSEVEAELKLEKRGGNRMTFYDVGLGACGGYNVGSDYIVALNSAQFGSSYPSPQCGKSITITYNGQSATATIQDECPSCGYGELDLSRGLFDHFAAESVGQFYGSWSFNDGSGSAPTTTSTYVAPTSTYVAPTSTYTPPTSTYVPPSTTSSSSSTYTPSTTSTSSSSSAVSSSSASSSAAASASSLVSASANTTAIPDSIISQNTDNNTSTTSTQSTGKVGNLVLFNQVVASLGHLVVVGASK